MERFGYMFLLLSWLSFCTAISLFCYLYAKADKTAWKIAAIPVGLVAGVWFSVHAFNLLMWGSLSAPSNIH